jgi:hypothetical protein
MYKKMPDIDYETLAKYPFLKSVNKMINKVFESKNVVTNINELDKWFIDYYGWSEMNTVEKICADDKYAKEKYNDYKSKLENGFNITFKDIDYNEEEMSRFLDGLDDGENIIVRCEG